MFIFTLLLPGRQTAKPENLPNCIVPSEIGRLWISKSCHLPYAKCWTVQLAESIALISAIAEVEMKCDFRDLLP
jgi:hypothetical protein